MREIGSIEKRAVVSLLALATALGAPAVAGSQEAKAKWPGRVHLTGQTYGKWSPKWPETPLQTKPELLIVDDGRYNYPNHGLNPDADTPTGLYAQPDQHSREVEAVPDGTILRVIAWTRHGQQVKDGHNYASTVWEKVQVAPGWPAAWVPSANTGFTSPLALRHFVGKPRG